jgi:hypothetical protein
MRWSVESADAAIVDFLEACRSDDPQVHINPFLADGRNSVNLASVQQTRNFCRKPQPVMLNANVGVRRKDVECWIGEKVMNQ